MSLKIKNHDLIIPQKINYCMKSKPIKFGIMQQIIHLSNCILDRSDFFNFSILSSFFLFHVKSYILIDKKLDENLWEHNFKKCHKKTLKDTFICIEFESQLILFKFELIFMKKFIFKTLSFFLLYKKTKYLKNARVNLEK